MLTSPLSFGGHMSTSSFGIALRRASLLGPIVAGLLATSCSDKPATAIVIAVSSEARTPKEIDKLRITVRRDGDDRFLQTYEFGTEANPLPGTLTVANDPDKDPDGTLIIRVEATRGSSDAPWKMIRESRLGFSKEKTKLLRMPLRYSCWNAPCENPNDTCQGGKCVPNTINIDALDDFTGNQSVVRSAKANLPGDGCFNPTYCLSSDKLSPVTLDDACSFPLGADTPLETLNVSMTWLDIAPDNPVPVVPDNELEGYTEHLGRITLAPGLCAAVQEGRASLSVSSACPAMQPNEPVCVVVDAPASCSATIAINEINSGDGQQKPFIELYNSTDCAASLDGFSMQYYAPSATQPSLLWTGQPGDSIEGKSWFVITLADGALTSSGGLYLYGRADAADVSTQALVPTDTVAWGFFATPPIGFGEGTPATDLMPGLSLGRVPDGGDSGDNIKDFSLVPASPGAANSSQPQTFTEKILIVASGFGNDAISNRSVVALYNPNDGSWPQEPIDKTTQLGVASNPELASIANSDGSVDALLVAKVAATATQPSFARWSDGSFSSPSTISSALVGGAAASYSLLSLGSSVLFFESPLASSTSGDTVETKMYDGSAFTDYTPGSSPPPALESGLGLVQKPTGEIVGAGANAGGLLLTTFGTTSATPWAFTQLTSTTPAPIVRPLVLLDSNNSPMFFYVDAASNNVLLFPKDASSPVTLGSFVSASRLGGFRRSDGSFLVIGAWDSLPGMSSLFGQIGAYSSAAGWTTSTTYSFPIVPEPLSAPVVLPGKLSGVEAEVFFTSNGTLMHYQLNTDGTVTDVGVMDSNNANNSVFSVGAVYVKVPSP
ncbi:MAG: hypothetical protein U0165_07765 [Polyangiaceae bacterium]